MTIFGCYKFSKNLVSIIFKKFEKFIYKNLKKNLKKIHI